MSTFSIFGASASSSEALPISAAAILPLRCASHPLSAWKASKIPNVDGGGGGGGVMCNPLRQGGRRFLDNMAWGYDHWAWFVTSDGDVLWPQPLLQGW